jgi:hypothetical protein
MAGTLSAAGGGSAGVPAETFAVKDFLMRHTPGSNGEDFPHGVPSAYSWYAVATGGTPSRPVPENTHMNAWGQIYVNPSNVRAANTRVAIKTTTLLALMPDSTEWQLLQRTDDVGGGGWKEDFSGVCGDIVIETEVDGSRSFVTTDGCNAHYWPELPFVAIPVVPRAVVSIAHTRLVLADAGAPDDRAQSTYLVGVGADWRKPDGSCPNDICTSVGISKFIKATNSWRAVVMSTLSPSELDTLPLPPADHFRLPDGTFPELD